MPVIGSLKVTVIEFRTATVPGGGLTEAMVGGIGSGAIVLNEKFRPRSLLAMPAFKPCTAMILVPVTSIEALAKSTVTNCTGSVTAPAALALNATVPAGALYRYNSTPFTQIMNPSSQW